MCYTCKAHPRAKGNLAFGRLRQRDITWAETQALLEVILLGHKGIVPFDYVTQVRRFKRGRKKKRRQDGYMI